MNGENQNNQAVLAEAFSAFTSTARGLEEAFASLRQRADRLDLELHETNRQMEAVFSAFPSGVVAADRLGRIHTINNAARAILCLAPHDKQVRFNLHDFTDYKREPLFFPSHSPEDRKLNRGKEKIPVRISYVPLSEAGDGLWILEDRSRLEELEGRVEHLDQLASLGRMALSIAHEIRNPLGAVAGFAGLLRRMVTGEKQNRYCQRIIEGVNRVEAIIRNLLAFARPGSVTLHRVDLCAMVRQSLDEWIGGQVTANLPDHPAVVKGDETALRQVLENFLRNAFEAGGDDVEIVVGLELRNCSWMLSVDDNGPGVPAALREEIFEPFRSEKEKGNGLGLAIIHRVVELHHGRVAAVDPVAGIGARFEVLLPAEVSDER